MWQLGVVIVLLHLRILRVALPQLGTKSNRQCVIVTEMLGDILSMYSYRLSDSYRHLCSAGIPSVACGNGLVASHCMSTYTVYFRWNDIFGYCHLVSGYNSIQQSQISSLISKVKVIRVRYHPVGIILTKGRL